VDLLILGASARAAAFSALRAGLRPSCADLFADRDLTLACSVNQVFLADYPDGLAAFADRVAPTHWLYTGALENYPDLVDRISTRHRLLGNSGPVLRAVRDPIALARAMKEADLDVPEVQVDPQDLPTDGSWLAKPRASGGGRGIRPWSGGETARAGPAYYQRRIEGLSLSALFVVSQTEMRLLGITRQFVGKPGNRFAYRGSLAPWPVEDEVGEQVERIGRVIVSGFRLMGIFGVDLIVKNEQVWPIEVNPRYTAAIETIEWASGQSFLADHVEAFGMERPVAPVEIRPEGFVGKAILHADRPFVWMEKLTLSTRIEQMPEIADIPEPGTTFETGDPVLTVLVSGDSPADCRLRLAGRLRDWRRRISRPIG
jgi:uncharacterized protein